MLLIAYFQTRGYQLSRSMNGPTPSEAEQVGAMIERKKTGHGAEEIFAACVRVAVEEDRFRFSWQVRSLLFHPSLPYSWRWLADPAMFAAT